MRAAVIGIGFIGREHIESIRRIPNTEVVAIVGRDVEKTRQQAIELGIEYSFDSVTDLIEADLNLDIVHNCTPNGLHFSVNKELMEAGLNVYCEKPLTLNASESEILVNLSKETNTKGGVNFNYRQNILVAEMKERVRTKSIGDVWFVQLEYLQDWLLFDTDYDWRMDVEKGGASRAIGDIGSHCFDTIQHIIGEKIIEVDVKLLKKFEERFQGDTKRPISNEDAAIIFVTFESGLKGLIRVSQVTAGKKNDFHISIEGDEQTLEWYQEQPDRLWIGNRDVGNTEIYASSQYLTEPAAELAKLPNGHSVGWNDAFTQGIRNFYQSVRTDDNNDYVNFQQAHHIMKIIDACLESADKNVPVRI